MRLFRITRREEEMTTLKEVARQAGVSPSTASAAIRGLEIVNPKTAKKVINAAQKLHYSVNLPARALQTGHTGILSLVVPGMSNDFYAQLADALSNEASANGYSLVTQLTGYNTDKELGLSRQASLSLSDGLFICNTQNTSRQLRRTTGDDFPLILIDDFSGEGHGNCDFIFSPSQEGILAILRHLVQTGRRRIAIVGIDAKNVNHHTDGSKGMNEGQYSQINRGIYAAQALESLGLPHDDSVFIPSAWGSSAGRTIGREYAQRVRSGQCEPFDAMDCLNDALALGLIRGLEDGGLSVPDDVAVTGFDGARTGELSYPSLTTVAVDYVGLAKSAFTLMISRINNTTGQQILPRTTIVGFRLEKRESTLGRHPRAGKREQAARQTGKRAEKTEK